MTTQVRYLSAAVAIGGFLAVSFTACVAWDAIFPEWAMWKAWAPLLPGFTWLSTGTFFVGLAEAFAYGFWFALVIPAVRWANRRLILVP